MTPSVTTRSWKTIQRVAAIVFAVVVFSTLAFVVGRASAGDTHAPTVAPAAVPAALAVTGGEADAGRCPIGRAC
jgi:hypothetical protein